MALVAMAAWVAVARWTGAPGLAAARIETPTKPSELSPAELGLARFGVAAAQHQLLSADNDLLWLRVRNATRDIESVADSARVSAFVGELSSDVSLNKPIDFGF
jgi:hypothetical protein